MAAAEIRQIADAVVADLGQPSALSQPVTVARAYMPYRERSELAQGIFLSVVPRNDEGALADRVTWEHGYQIDIGVQTKVAGMAPADLDPLVDLVQEVADFFNGAPPSGRRERLIAKQHDPLFDQQHLVQHGCFTSVIRLTFRGWRQAA